MLLRLSAFFLIIAVVYGEDKDLTSLIDEVFGSQPQPEAKNNVGECTCVPYYLCQNNTLITDGVGLIDIRLKEEHCENYLDVCCGGGERLSDDNRITPPPVVRDGCGRHNPEGVGFRITGDSDGEAQFGEFPWMVAVLREEDLDGTKLNVFQCGGALIHPEVVITAAHCVSSNMNYKIRAGEWDTQTTNELFPHQDANVREVVLHPKYYAGAVYNDIALLFLSSAITLADNIDVICLPRQDENFDRSKCYASGWGKDFWGKEGKYQVIMKKVLLPVVPNPQCQESLRLTRLGPHFKLHSSFMCAGGETGRDTCKGDGGSPLACPIGNTGKYVHAGIVAWGVGCGEFGTPGVYANVALFRNWIDTQMQTRQLDTKYYQY